MSNDDQRSSSGEGHYYKQEPHTTQNSGPGSQGEKLPGQPLKQRNIWRAVAMVMSIIAVVFAATTLLAYNHIINPPAARLTSIATQAPQQTATVSAPTSASTSSSMSTVQPSSPSNYSALQPGPGCDKNGGTWTPQGLGDITCGTAVSPSSANTRGYLFLQLPNNKAFSSNNKIGVIGNPGTPNGFLQCIGLDEQDANTGFLAEYCGDGHWFIYSISSDGTIVQTLAKDLTSTRTTVDIALTLQGTTLSFSMDNEMHEVNSITPIQPTKVAITYFANSGYAGSITTNNFSYTVLSS
ncbi:MAG TPA: hypothetical protein VGL94_16485 [Ktedonobacteraceae bacterium]|jgi:hypothetical protein